MTDLAFPFIHRNALPSKPRSTALTEMRGPYYTVMGPRYLSDVCETMGPFIDPLKYAGGSFCLMRPEAMRQLNDIAHEHELTVCTGGFIESVPRQGRDAVSAYVETAKSLGFDIIEVSTGFIAIPADDWVRLCETVRKAGLKPKPESPRSSFTPFTPARAVESG